jgi:hypothetical protein
MRNNKRPLLIIPEKYESIEAMFESEEYKEFVEEHKFKMLTSNTYLDSIVKDGIPLSEVSVIIGSTRLGPSMLEKFIIAQGGLKIS